MDHSYNATNYDAHYPNYYLEDYEEYYEDCTNANAKSMSFDEAEYKTQTKPDLTELYISKTSYEQSRQQHLPNSSGFYEYQNTLKPHEYHYQYPKQHNRRPNSPYRKPISRKTELFPLPVDRYAEERQFLPDESQFSPKIVIGRDGRQYKHDIRYPKMYAGKKFPVTLKTSRYYVKKPTLNKKASSLHFPVVLDHDQKAELKITPDQRYQPPSAGHRINSHGDVNEENADVTFEYGNDSIKEFAKFLKPKVPASIRAKQDKNVEDMAAASEKNSMDNMAEDQQKTSNSVHEESFEEKPSEQKNDKVDSFNYDTISQKLSPYLPEKPTTSLTTSLDRKPSKFLDDQGALELHRSKSYIVDLIDRALSRELGTVPRDKIKIDHQMNPKKAIESIGRHRRAPFKDDLCYEITAALTDSFISNATVPSPNDEGNQRGCQSNSKNKICTCTLDDSSRNNYFKQLKHLRWGHIKHIQHEAKRLADLEEFLDRIEESNL